MSRLWYEKPAAEWEEALPLGNGRLGGMIFGGIDHERIQVNEESMWYGKPMQRNNPDTKKYLPRIRELVFDGELEQAEKLVMAAMSGCPNSMRPYQLLGDIRLITEIENSAEHYRRELDLEEAICRVSFEQGGHQYYREIFTSIPEDCMMIKLTTDREDGVNYKVRIERDRFCDMIHGRSGDSVYLSGNLGEGGTHFTMGIKAVAVGGQVQVIGEYLCVEDAKEVILYFTSFTDFQNIKASEPLAHGADAIYEKLRHRCEKTLVQASQAEYAELKRRHVEEYRKLYKRVVFELGEAKQRDDIPTDVLLRWQPDSEQELIKLIFDYGRYLLISSSYKGQLPANLQGIWNNQILPAWDSKFTININAQMNYWPAEICDLPECHQIFLDFIKTMAAGGRQTAREMYGCRGWVAHHNTDAFGDTAPQDICITSSYWVMGAAWLCTHFWTHYEYTLDLTFLKKIFPVIVEAALFFVDFLIEKDGYLVTCPSVSPENTYWLSNGQKGAISYGVTMDNQLLRDLFSQVAEAARLLDMKDYENEFTDMGVADGKGLIIKIEDMLARLAPTQIGSDGRIMEWREEYEECEPGHRHISHLYGLYPSDQITVDKTPQLAAAAEAVLTGRLQSGGGHTGWSRAWIINMYARLWNSEKVYENLQAFIKMSLYQNLFDKHPPFQIDGNFGMVAGIAEMLLQSNYERIVLLPALPETWRSGTISGLRVKGNAKVALSWNDGCLTRCKIKAESDLSTSVKYKDRKWDICIPAGEEKVIL